MCAGLEPERLPSGNLGDRQRHVGTVENFAKALRAERAWAGLTQEELGQAIGYDKSTISIYENAARQEPPSRDVVFLIEDALEVADSRLLKAAGYLSREDYVETDQRIAGSTLTVRPTFPKGSVAGGETIHRVENTDVVGVTDSVDAALFRNGDKLSPEQRAVVQAVIDAMLEEKDAQA